MSEEEARRIVYELLQDHIYGVMQYIPYKCLFPHQQKKLEEKWIKIILNGGKE